LGEHGGKFEIELREPNTITSIIKNNKGLNGNISGQYTLSSNGIFFFYDMTPELSLLQLNGWRFERGRIYNIRIPSRGILEIELKKVAN
jgi:hypothetical protein